MLHWCSDLPVHSGQSQLAVSIYFSNKQSYLSIRKCCKSKSWGRAAGTSGRKQEYISVVAKANWLYLQHTVLFSPVKGNARMKLFQMEENQEKIYLIRCPVHEAYQPSPSYLSSTNQIQASSDTAISDRTNPAVWEHLLQGNQSFLMNVLLIWVYISRFTCCSNSISAVIFRQLQMNVSECHEFHLNKTEMSENLPRPRHHLSEWVDKYTQPLHCQRCSWGWA